MSDFIRPGPRYLTRSELVEKLGCKNREIGFAIKSGYVFNHGRWTTYRHYIKWCVEHPEFDPIELHRARRRVSDSNYRRGNIQARIALSLRNRLRLLLRKTGANKAGSVIDFIGCDIPALRAHLELKFRAGMTWENYGPFWHIDHVKACARFDFSDPVQQRACFHYTNLQPLLAIENQRKGAR